jgi:hypothetical protein
MKSHHYLLFIHTFMICGNIFCSQTVSNKPKVPPLQISPQATANYVEQHYGKQKSPHLSLTPRTSTNIIVKQLLEAFS